MSSLITGTKKSDGNPLDICVVSERPINCSEVILNARVVGDLPMNDHGEADDKIIAVLENDTLWVDVMNINQLPEVIVDWLRYYFFKLQTHAWGRVQGLHRSSVWP